MSGASQALQKIARGAGIVFAGTVVSMLFGFLSRAVIARHFSTSEYGVFNLALTVLSIALVVATLGFQNSLPREVAFYKEKEASKLRPLISTALVIVVLNSLILMILLLISSREVSLIFHNQRLLHALKVTAFALPFSTLISVIVSISQGFGRVKERVYFQNAVYPTLFLIFVVAGTLLNFPFAYVFSAYVAAQALTLLALVFDVWKVKLFEFKTSLDLKLGRGLIAFSLPLLFTGILSFIMAWTDTLMLGYYKSSEVVGLYNAASPLAKLLPIFLGSASFLYVPIASQLYAQGKIKEMGRVYQILTKWIFLLTLPIFVMMFLFTEVTIGFFFGPKYVSASLALQILSLGFIFHTLLGPNGWSLIIVKEGRFISVSTLIAAVFNVVLNALLIPPYGMEGAAIATAVSYFISNALNSLRLYRRTRIHPFSWNYVKPLVISFALLGLAQGLHARAPNIWYAVPVLAVFLGVCFFLVLISRSVDKEDVELFLAVEKRLGVDLRIIKRTLERFV